MSTKPQNDSEALLGCIGALAGIFLLLPLSFFLDGWALALLWGWFVHPTFAWAPALTIAQAVGLSIVVRAVVPSQVSYKDHEVSTVSTWALAVIGPLLFVAIGWFVHHFFF